MHIWVFGKNDRNSRANLKQCLYWNEGFCIYNLSALSYSGVFADCWIRIWISSLQKATVGQYVNCGLNFSNPFSTHNGFIYTCYFFFHLGDDWLDKVWTFFFFNSKFNVDSNGIKQWEQFHQVKFTTKAIFWYSSYDAVRNKRIFLLCNHISAKFFV